MELLVFLVPLGLLWLFIIRPQQRKLKEQQLVTRRAGFGDEIVTAGGFVATIVQESDTDDEDNELGPNEIVVALTEGVEVKMLRHGISQVLSQWDGVYDDGSIEDGFDEIDEDDTDDDKIISLTGDDAEESETAVDGD